MRSEVATQTILSSTLTHTYIVFPIPSKVNRYCVDNSTLHFIYAINVLGGNCLKRRYHIVLDRHCRLWNEDLNLFWENNHREEFGTEIHPEELNQEIKRVKDFILKKNTLPTLTHRFFVTITVREVIQLQ